METDKSARHINVESDFELTLIFSNGPIPSHPWKIDIYTSSTEAYNIYTAGFDGEKYNKCIPIDDTTIIVWINDHRLRSGELIFKVKEALPNDIFPDHRMDIVTPGNMPIVLWDGPSDEFELPAEIKAAIITALQGEPGADASISEVTAEVSETTGKPSVAVEMGGTPQDRSINFRFDGLKGETPEITADLEGGIYLDGVKLTDAIPDAVKRSDEQTSRARSQADHPPKIVTVDDTRYWAFWDEVRQEYEISTVRADGGPVFAVFDIDPATMILRVTYQPGYGTGSEFNLVDGYLVYQLN